MADFNAKFNGDVTFKATFGGDSSFGATFGDTNIVETGDYNNLINKPSYNGVVWQGDKTFEDMGDHTLTNIEIKEIYDRVFKGGN